MLNNKSFYKPKADPVRIKTENINWDQSTLCTSLQRKDGVSLRNLPFLHGRSVGTLSPQNSQADPNPEAAI